MPVIYHSASQTFHLYNPYYSYIIKLLPDGTPVRKGMKSGDVDPRCEKFHCYTASDKALAVGGGVLEAILHLTGALRERR